MTKNARQILDIVEASRDHLTAREIYAILKSKGEKTVLATVYNNLSYLTREGLIIRLSIEGDGDRYDRVVRHDHLICSKCGKISDVYLDDISSMIKKKCGNGVNSYDLRIFYTCPECREK